MNETLDPRTWNAPVTIGVSHRGPFSLSVWSTGAFAAVIVILIVRLFLVIGQQMTDSLQTYADLRKGILVADSSALLALALGLFSVALDIANWLDRD